MVQSIAVEQVRYNAKAGRYIGPGGGFLSNADIQIIVTQEQNRLNAKLQRELNKLFDNKTSIKDVQLKSAELLKESQLRIITLGAGGDESLRGNPELFRYFGQSGAHLKREYAVLRANGKKIADGELTQAQIRDRFRRQSIRLNEAFFRAQMLTRISQQGHNEGRRILDSSVLHCPDCPGYQALEWVPVGDIVPKGTACVCGGYCHCTVFTRFSPERAIQELQGGTLIDQVRRSEQTISETISDRI